VTVQERLQFEIEQELSAKSKLIEKQPSKYPGQAPGLLNTTTLEGSVPEPHDNPPEQLGIEELLHRVSVRLEQLHTTVKERNLETVQQAKRLTNTEAFAQGAYEKVLEQKEVLETLRRQGQRRGKGGSFSPALFMGLAFLAGLLGAFGFYLGWWILEMLT
jgi:hypothetical protein